MIPNESNFPAENLLLAKHKNPSFRFRRSSCHIAGVSRECGCVYVTLLVKKQFAPSKKATRRSRKKKVARDAISSKNCERIKPIFGMRASASQKIIHIPRAVDIGWSIGPSSEFGLPRARGVKAAAD